MRRVVAAMCVALMLATAASLAWAQTQVQFVKPEPVLPMVLSGSDIGFRVIAQKGDRAVGQLVVRVDGRWVEAEFAGGVKPVGIR